MNVVSPIWLHQRHSKLFNINYSKWYTMESCWRLSRAYKGTSYPTSTPNNITNTDN